MTDTQVAIESPQELAAELESLIPELNERDHKFATSLVDSGKKGKLSEKQLFWVHKLIERAVKGEPEPPKEQVAELSGLIDLFKHAKQHMKYPKIRVTVDGQPFMLALAGPKSKKCGWVTLTDGGPFGSNKFYGWVSPEGEWQQPTHIDDGAKKLLHRLLKAFSHDAQKAATKYGKMTGACCFCAKTIGEGENEISVAMGYGPSCAKKWGLPWGAKAAKAKHGG